MFTTTHADHLFGEKQLLGAQPGATRTTTKVNGEAHPPSNLVMQYWTLRNNRPATYGNTVCMWEDYQIPWGRNPDRTEPVTKDDPEGDKVFNGLELQKKTYIVAYTTGNSPLTASSTLLFTPGQDKPEVFEPSVNVLYVGSDSLLVGWNSPDGNDPRMNKNWLGLWKGTSFTWDGRNRLYKMDIDSNVSRGNQAFNGIKLAVNETYTVVYATGQLDTNICASATFTVS